MLGSVFVAASEILDVPEKYQTSLGSDRAACPMLPNVSLAHL